MGAFLPGEPGQDDGSAVLVYDKYDLWKLAADGSVWMGTDSSQLARYDRVTGWETVRIPGWDAGVAGMRVGGRRKLTIPSAMAYGARGAGGVIQPHEPLVFVVDLLSVD